MIVLCAISLCASLASTPELYSAGLWAALRHDAGFVELARDLDEVEWPETLCGIGEVVEGLAGASGYVSGRMVTVHFSGADRPPEWYEEIVAQVRQVPGVIDAACLPPVPMPSTPVFVTEEMVLPKPVADSAPDVPPCERPLVAYLDIVVDTGGATRDPVLSRVSRDLSSECVESLLEWARQLRWHAAHRKDGPVPSSFSLPVRLE